MVTDTQNSVFWKSIEYLFHLFFILFPFVLYSSFLYNGTSTRSLNLIIFSGLIGIGFALWLFTIGFLKLSFWYGVLAVIIWPYYLGAALSVVQ